MTKGRGYKIYNPKESENKHKEESKDDAAEDTDPIDKEMEEYLSNLLITHVYNILHSCFPNVELYINDQQIYNSKGLYAHKFYISNLLKGVVCAYKRVLHFEGYIFAKSTDEFMDAPLSEPFSTR